MLWLQASKITLSIIYLSFHQFLLIKPTQANQYLLYWFDSRRCPSINHSNISWDLYLIPLNYSPVATSIYLWSRSSFLLFHWCRLFQLTHFRFRLKSLKYLYLNARHPYPQRLGHQRMDDRNQVRLLVLLLLPLKVKRTITCSRKLNVIHQQNLRWSALLFKLNKSLPQFFSQLTIRLFALLNVSRTFSRKSFAIICGSHRRRASLQRKQLIRKLLTHASTILSFRTSCSTTIWQGS